MTDTIKSPNLTLRYSFIQGFYWMNFSAIMGFASLYLLDSGFSNTEIGMIMAVAGIISAILQPIIAGYADYPSSPSLKKIVLTLTLIQMILGVLMLLSFRKSILFTGILYGSTITLLQLLNPFINSLGMESINQGKALNFGAARGMGSVAYAIMSYILGAIAEKAGAVSVPLSIAVLSLGFIGILVLFPFHKTAIAVSVRKPAASSPLAFFIKYKRFAVVLIGCIFIYLSHVLLNSFTFQIVESKGGGSAEMGTAMAIAALIELPTLFLFTFMLKKAPCHFWFRICGIFFMLKSLGTLLAPDIPVFYGVQILQMLGWGLIAVSSVYYVNSVMEEQDAIKGQAYITMTYTLGSVTGALLGGALIDAAGVNAMLIFATVSAAVGMVILLFATERTNSSRI